MASLCLNTVFLGLCLIAEAYGSCGWPFLDYDAFYDFTNPENDTTHPNLTEHVPFIGTGCSRQGVLKITLASREEDSSRRRVLVDMFFTDPKEWVFNLGDSSTNDGDGGDASTQSNDAEVRGKGQDLSGYLSADGNWTEVLNAINVYSTRLILSVADGYMEWTGDNDKNHFSHSNLFALNGQADNEGTVNYELYLGLNRVIYGEAKTGSGLCKFGIIFQPEY